MHEDLHVCEYGGQKLTLGVLFIFLPAFLTQSFKQHGKISWSVRLRDSPVSSAGIIVYAITYGLEQRCWGLNSNIHACMEETLLTELSIHP